jgi:hypothetical protein
MADQTIDITKTIRTNWDVKWNSLPLGGCNKVDLSKLALLLEPVKIGSLGNMKLDDRVIGLEDGAMIGVEVREITRAQIELAMPWFAGTTVTGTIQLMPPINTLLANAYAHALVLHPRGEGDVNQDITLTKTVPVQLFNLSRDGTKDDVWELMFRIYPDLSVTPPANPYGHVGA